jgi:uncharacterized protein (TIGR03067 family)
LRKSAGSGSRGGIDIDELELSADQYVVTVGQAVDGGTCKLDTTRALMAREIVGTAGPNRGKTILPVCELIGDELRVCYDLTG